MDQSHFHTPDCGCDHDADARALARAMANVKRDPQGAVRTLESAHVPEPMLFQAVVNCSLNVPRIRRSGAPAMFLRFIKEGYRSNAEPHPDPSILPPRQWERPVIGILNILVAIRDDKSQAQDSAIVSELIRGYETIRDTIWRDLNYLLPPGPYADFRRCIVAKTLNLFSEYGHKMNMLDDVSIGIAMQCWLNMSSNPEHRNHAVVLIGRLFGELPPDMAPSVLDRAVRAVSVDAINLRINQVLVDPGLLNDGLLYELEVLETFLTSGRPWTQAFLRARMYDPMVQAVQRQLKTGSVATTASMNGIASILLTNFPSIANHSMPFLIDMLEKTDLMDVAAQGLVITDANGTNHWMKFFERAVHIVDCKNARCPYLSTTAYMKVCKERLEAVYFPTGYALRKNGPKNPKTLQLWEQFASVMGVDEAALLTKWKADKQCCNPLCKRRGEGPNAIVMKCTACQSVYYHGSACQKADWKRHKHECKKA